MFLRIAQALPGAIPSARAKPVGRYCSIPSSRPVVNGIPGIIQDPIDLLLAKCNFPNERSTVLVFSTCNTVE